MLEGREGAAFGDAGDPGINKGREHRERLAGFWGILPGSSVLEIGCGQGDTTEALLDRVGDNGFVHAIDTAGPDYGSPETLGEAREKLLSGGNRQRLRMDFGTDVFSAGLAGSGYDYVVLSHSLWYLSSQDELRGILTQARNFAKTLCLAEWDLRITSAAQACHARAVAAQFVA
jgi:protein-L-isoaspartate O-methyltransferase